MTWLIVIALTAVAIGALSWLGLKAARYVPPEIDAFNQLFSDLESKIVPWLKRHGKSPPSRVRDEICSVPETESNSLREAQKSIRFVSKETGYPISPMERSFNAVMRSDPVIGSSERTRVTREGKAAAELVLQGVSQSVPAILQTAPQCYHAWVALAQACVLRQQTGGWTQWETLSSKCYGYALLLARLSGDDKCIEQCEKFAGPTGRTVAEALCEIHGLTISTQSEREEVKPQGR